MELLPSVHVDTFCRDHLPPVDQWPELVFDLPELHYPERLNCAAALLETATQHPDRPCLHQPGSATWTYAELDAHANRVARVLVDDLQIVPGNRVLLRGPNSQWLTAAWFGALKAGAVVVTTMALLREGELRTIDEIAHLDAALVDHRYLEGMPPDIRTLAYGDSQWAARMDRTAARFDHVRTSRDDVALLAFTSGTTGRPKATMHFHRDVMANCDTFSRYVLQPTADDIFIGTPPYAFTFGLGGDLLFPLHVGASTVLVEKATPLQLADLIDEYGATICFTAPTAYKAMIHAQRKLPTLTKGVSAGEHLPQATWQEFRDLTGVELIDGIGATEMLHIFVSASGADIRPGSTGRAVPGYQARIVDGLGQPVPAGAQGRLAVKGPTGCRYLDDPRQLAYVQDGWNITGDTFTQDEDGYFWYHARSDDMIVSSGYNIAAPEVEEALLRHPGVAECGVIGVPDEARGSIVKAYVVLAAGVEPLTAKELQDFVKQQIAPYKYPRAIEFVNALPRTATGKLQRFRLRTPD
ncbi:AMP-binding protein [Leekyejoonella antrihumi]|uniref:AMP-binding protein n=1 Tax=Leekyejoonella antrihumi TaxID=1660198 RepID=A0A563E0L8_9MICO|nr:AMP-binding protein [Leekyejoonella antrihumi]TWP35434.1 AMP-binding protein [Leekyejoonella antrihumi]